MKRRITANDTKLRGIPFYISYKGKELKRIYCTNTVKIEYKDTPDEGSVLINSDYSLFLFKDGINTVVIKSIKHEDNENISSSNGIWCPPIIYFYIFNDIKFYNSYTGHQRKYIIEKESPFLIDARDNFIYSNMCCSSCHYNECRWSNVNQLSVRFKQNSKLENTCYRDMNDLDIFIDFNVTQEEYNQFIWLSTQRLLLLKNILFENYIPDDLYPMIISCCLNKYTNSI